jgi:hypothetical protein
MNQTENRRCRDRIVNPALTEEARAKFEPIPFAPGE